MKYDVEGNNSKHLKVKMLLHGIRVRRLPSLLLYNHGTPLASHSRVITKVGFEELLEDNSFSKMDEFEAEAKSDSKEETKKDGASKEVANGETRGFVSFSDQYEEDDYMLSN